MKKRIITFMDGDLIGLEIGPRIREIIDVATEHCVEWEMAYMGLETKKRCGNPLPQETLDSIERNKVAIKGPTHSDGTFSSVNVRLRKELDLFANVRLVKNLPGFKARYTGVDLVIFRENTEDLYAGMERDIEGGAEAIKRITEKGSERIVRAAFEYAVQKNRKSVIAIHKANIMPKTDGRYFLEVAKRVAADYTTDYPELNFDDLIVDNACMQLVLDPTWLDVLVTENLYGDIVSDLCAGLVGGLGVIPGANIGIDYAVFEAAHGTAPRIAGKNWANPSAMLLSAVMMFEHLQEHEIALRIRNALIDTLREGVYVTRDLNPENGVDTDIMARAIIRKIEES